MKNEEKIIEVHESQKVKFIATDGRSVVVEIKTITPAEAAEMVDSNREDRKINDGYVSQYARDMKNGEWELNGSTILIDKTRKRIDGNHRLLGCIEAGVPFTTLVVSDVKNEVKLTVDQGRGRSFTDQVSVAGFDPATAAAVRGYIKLSMLDRNDNGDYRRVTMKELMAELQTSPELYVKAAKYGTKISKCAEFDFAGRVISGSYVYLVKSCGYEEEKITSFFNQVANLADTCSATRALNRTLSGWKRTHEWKKCPYETQQGLVIKAWNAFIKGEEVDYMSYSQKVEKDKSAKFL